MGALTKYRCRYKAVNGLVDTSTSYMMIEYRLGSKV